MHTFLVGMLFHKIRTISYVIMASDTLTVAITLKKLAISKL